MSRRMPITLTEELADRLAALSSETGVPQAEIVRRALDPYLGIGVSTATPMQAWCQHAPDGRFLKLSDVSEQVVSLAMYAAQLEAAMRDRQHCNVRQNLANLVSGTLRLRETCIRQDPTVGTERPAVYGRGAVPLTPLPR